MKQFVLLCSLLLAGCEHKTYQALDVHNENISGCTITKVLDENTLLLDCGVEVSSYKYGLRLSNTTLSKGYNNE